MMLGRSMLGRLGCLLVAGVLATFLPGIGTPASAATHHVRLDGVTATLASGTHQVVTVNHTAGDRARVTLWAWHAGRGWRQVVQSSDGRIGYGGLVAGWKRKQGSGATPLGTFSLISSFGTHRALASWKLPYRQIAHGDYWVEDNGSAFYNRYRNKADGGFRWWLPTSSVNSSELLSSFPGQYEYSIVTSFNLNQLRHRGAGIFLHVNGSGATAGCVSAPRWFLQRTMAVLNPQWHPAIAVGR
jgi:L,D-peptidoglycan transpeptidase YkuD (ErfK/YbiS/YcfS/YnhG family)